MKTVKVKASTEYNVIIEKGLIKTAGELTAKIVSPCKALIVSDSTVFSLYGETVFSSLENSGFLPFVFKHNPGEDAKSIGVLSEIYDFLLENNFTKTDIIVALGGGVTSDLAGFAAATYLRGIKYITLPTTLLSMADASVGGKTAVNFNGIKNQIGAVYQPSLVICDTDTLKTLPEKEFTSGCGEIVKYAVLMGKDIVNSVKCGIKNNIEKIIFDCVKYKSDIVAKDEFDNETRQILNLGHTVGHAIEKYSNNSVSHGEAVAIGLAAISRYANSCNLLSESDLNTVISMLESNGLPISFDCKTEDLLKYALLDKKIRNKKINLIVPLKIGKCEIISADTGELSRVIDYVL